MAEKQHISVCICTYKRPRLLELLLCALEAQETQNFFSFSIVVVDNDWAESARRTVESRARRSMVFIRYAVEPEQNIALARNKAIANSQGDFIAFIDDDEFPDSRWLLNLYKAIILFETAGVLGPVIPRYEAIPPKWVLKGRFFERPTYYSGYFLNWWLTRTGNCLLRSSLFGEKADWFLPRFGSGGEDRDFFKRKIGQGHLFVWCDEAPLRELVPRERWRKGVMLKRALLRGKMTYHARKQRPVDTLSSAAAALYYLIALPFLLLFSPLFGFDVFMKYMIRECDHLGKLFALFRIDVVKERYITSLDS